MCDRFIMLHSRNQHNIVNNYTPMKINLKNKLMEWNQEWQWSVWYKWILNEVPRKWAYGSCFEGPYEMIKLQWEVYQEKKWCSRTSSCQLVAVQLLSLVWVFVIPWTTACQASLSCTISRSLLKLKPIEWVMPSNHLILCCPLLLLPSVFPSTTVFPKESALHIRWPKDWSFSISPSNEYSGLISFRIGWFDLAVQRALKSFLQYHSSKASILQHSAFFMVQLSPPYMTTGKIITLTIWIFVGKVMSLHAYILSRFIIAFLPRSKHLLISCLQSPFEWFWNPEKSVIASTFHPSICHEVMGPDAMILVFLLFLVTYFCKFWELFVKHVLMLSHSVMSDSEIPRTVACQAPLFMGIL